jgi:asparagine synthase (glutamine-hydrolysing)
MCGIAGLISLKPDVPESELARRARCMEQAIAYRGPDGSGLWTGEGAALAHRRLAIVDLTPSGAQPMVSQDGRWVISYNGEAYNAEDIAKTMPELNRRGRSDTEIIVESVARRGLDRTLTDLNGMFAIALWDRATRTLHLMRDRLGIKPLFYAQSKEAFCFASELKSFAAGGFEFELDGASVASFLRFGYVPAPHSIYQGVSKLLPGEVVSVTAGAIQRKKYWSLEAVAKRGLQHPFAGSDADATEALDRLLAEAVSGHMISDVPLGAFLSGGIDSSTVVALMVAAQHGPVRTFSIGFPDFGYDESAHAKAVASHLGSVHEEMKVTASDALSVVPQLAEMYDEPFADSSQIPTFAISKMTRARVTVALSGDGGDELFAGYNRYSLAAGRLAQLTRLPLALRRGSAAVFDALADSAADRLGPMLPKPLQAAQPADKLKKLAEILRLDGTAIYLRLVSQNPDPAALILGLPEHPIDMRTEAAEPGSLEWMQFFDTDTYLPDDILQKVDRASMAVSLEVRPPLLDHRVVEFAWTLPRHMRIRNGETKWLLRRVLDRYVPRALIDRPKMGFGIPLADWLRGPLRDWAEDQLDPVHLAGGLLDAAAVRKLWFEHVSGRRNWAYALWTILMFEAWRRRWAGAIPAQSLKAPVQTAVEVQGL